MIDVFARLCVDDPTLIEIDERNYLDIPNFSLKLMGALCINTQLQRLILCPRNAKEKERYEALLAFALHVNPHRPATTSWIYVDDFEATNIYCKLRYYTFELVLSLLELK